MKLIASFAHRLKRAREVLSPSRFRPQGSATPPQYILPIEIWDRIVHDLQDAELLRAATVCRAFNALCVAACFERHTVPVPEGEFGDIQEIPPVALRALRLTCIQPPMQALRCHFQKSNIFQGLDLGSRSCGVRPDCVHLSRRGYSWRLDAFQFSPGGFFGMTCRALRAVTPPFWSRTLVCLHDGNWTKKSAINQIQTAAVYSGGWLSEPYTLVLFNLHVSTNLNFSYTSVPAPLLADFLANVTFRALNSFMIDDGVEPQVLGAFLLRHQNLKTFEYNVREESAPVHSTLINPPIAHPSLDKLSAGNTADIHRAIEACTSRRFFILLSSTISPMHPTPAVLLDSTLPFA
ncbi:hypothetical protein B0H19DRAFT_1253072 [Mycena capillaripes]|nr:hypothetical protein B0H19DRAFT_1253072 [Mycena capillaripes]